MCLPFGGKKTPNWQKKTKSSTIKQAMEITEITNWKKAARRLLSLHQWSYTSAYPELQKKKKC